MQSLLKGLPLETQTYSSYEPSGIESLLAGAKTGTTIYDLLKLYSGDKTAGTPQPGGVAGTIGGTPLAG
jgi:hypothetical protein